MKRWTALCLLSVPVFAAAPGEVTEELVLRHHSAAEVAGWLAAGHHQGEYAVTPEGIRALTVEPFSAVLKAVGTPAALAELRLLVGRLDAPPSEPVRLEAWIASMSDAQVAELGLAPHGAPPAVVDGNLLDRLRALRAAPPTAVSGALLRPGEPSMLVFSLPAPQRVVDWLLTVGGGRPHEDGRMMLVLSLADGNGRAAGVGHAVRPLRGQFVAVALPTPLPGGAHYLLLRVDGQSDAPQDPLAEGVDRFGFGRLRFEGLGAVRFRLPRPTGPLTVLPDGRLNLWEPGLEPR